MKRTQSKTQPHVVYVVEGKDDNQYWTKVGAAWPHKDGKGYNVSLSCLPVNGRLVIRDSKADAKEE